MDFKHYCGVENAICNKNIQYKGQPPCCLSCIHTCCNCIIKGKEDTLKCFSKVTKDEIDKIKK